MRILQLCFRVPFPPHDGGAIAMYNITKGLKEAGHEVTVLAFNTPKHFQEEHVLKDIAALKTVFVNTSVSPIKAFLNLFTSTPYNLERFISSNFEQTLIDLLQKNHFDVVHFEGMYLAWYVDVVKKYFNGPLILRTHNLEYIIWERLSQGERFLHKKWYLKNLSKKLKNYEKKYFSKFNAVAAISNEDGEIILELSPNANVQVIPPGVECHACSDEKSSATSLCMISALEWKPNLEGLEWFLKEVWPKVHEQCPDLEFHIAGKRTPDHILKLKLKNVKVHGFVPDAASFMRKYGLMLVPLFSGSGTRIKILEGMAVGKPIVSTTIGAEGMEYLKGENIVIADTLEEWIKAITDYYNNPSHYNTIGNNGKEWIMKNYSIQESTKSLIHLYQGLL